MADKFLKVIIFPHPWNKANYCTYRKTRSSDDVETGIHTHPSSAFLNSFHFRWGFRREYIRQRTLPLLH